MDFWIIIVGAVALIILIYVVFLSRPSRSRWNGTGGDRWVSSSRSSSYSDTSWISSSDGGGSYGGDSGGSCGDGGGGGGGGCD